MRQIFFFLVFGLFSFINLHAQGGELLVQQYNQYPYDHEFYRTWNFDVFVQPHISNAMERNTKARINLSVGGNVHYKLAKSSGISAGIHYHRISYQYQLANDTSVDRLRFLRLPLVLSVYPLKRIRLSLGGTYNFLIKATGQAPPATERVFYTQKEFKNSIGILAGISYRVWRKWSVSVNYMVQKKSHTRFSRQTQNFDGIAVGFHYTLLHPTQRNVQ